MNARDELLTAWLWLSIGSGHCPPKAYYADAFRLNIFCHKGCWRLAGIPVSRPPVIPTPEEE